MARGSIQTQAAVPLLLPIYTEMINNLDNATGVEELPFSFSAKKPFTTGDLIWDGKRCLTLSEGQRSFWFCCACRASLRGYTCAGILRN